MSWDSLLCFSSLDWISPKHIPRILLQPIALISLLKTAQMSWVCVVCCSSPLTVYILHLHVLWSKFDWIISVWLLLDRPDEWVFNQEKLCGGEEIMQFYVVLCSIPTRKQMWDFIYSIRRLLYHENWLLSIPRLKLCVCLDGSRNWKLFYRHSGERL